MKSNNLLKKFGLRIRKLRLQNKLSQEDLATKADIHWTYISGIERGLRNISLKKIVKIAKALNVNPKELVDI